MHPDPDLTNLLAALECYLHTVADCTRRDDRTLRHDVVAWRDRVSKLIDTRTAERQRADKLDRLAEILGDRETMPLGEVVTLLGVAEAEAVDLCHASGRPVIVRDHVRLVGAAK